MHKTPAKYLVLIDASGGMVARLFDAARVQVTDFDASSEEVAVMLAGLTPEAIGDSPEWQTPLRGHSAAERRAAQVYTLDV